MSKRTLILGAAVVAVVAVSLGFFWPFSNHKKTLRISGTVEVQEVRLGSKVGGRVAEVFVHEGDEVDAERDLVRFEAPELQAQKAKLEQKLVAAQLEFKKAKDGPRPQEKAQAKAAMEAAKARWDRAEKGWREEEKKQATHDLEAARADLEAARKNYERIEKLNFQVTPAEYDAARAKLITAQEHFNSIQARVDMLNKGSREEDKREAKAEYDKAKAQFELLEEGTRQEDIKIAEIQIEEIKARIREVEANLKETVVSARSKVRIEVLGVRKGDIVPPNSPVIRALQTDDRWVKVFVPSTDLGKVRHGDSVEVTSDSYPDRKFKGTIIHIATISEFTPRNVQSLDERKHQVFAIKVRVEDGGDVFKAGMAAEVLLPLRD